MFPAAIHISPLRPLHKSAVQSLPAFQLSRGISFREPVFTFNWNSGALLPTSKVFWLTDSSEKIASGWVWYFSKLILLINRRRSLSNTNRPPFPRVATYSLLPRPYISSITIFGNDACNDAGIAARCTYAWLLFWRNSPLLVA